MMNKTWIICVFILMASVSYAVDPPPPEPGVDISVAPVTADFGMIPAGSISLPATFTVKNIGTFGDLIISSIISNSTVFAVQNENCTNLPIPLMNTCTFDVVFSPLSSGIINATVAVTSNDPYTPVIDIPLSGEGTVPDILIADPSLPYDDRILTFGDITEGNSLTKTVGVTNLGKADLTISSVGQNDTLAAPFTAISNCVGILAQNQLCEINVTFSPVSTGPFSDTFDIASNDPDEASVTVSVTGNGLSSVVNNLPTPPGLVSPSDGEAVSGTSVTLKWATSTDPDGDAISYELYYGTDQNFTIPVYVSSLGQKGFYLAGSGFGLLIFGIVFGSRRKNVLPAMALIITGTVLIACGSSGSSSPTTATGTTGVTAVTGMGNVEGTVRDMSTGTALENATVTISGKSYATKADGYYIIKDLDEGTHTVTAVRAEYLEYAGSVTVQKGATSIKHLLMTAGYSYTVTGLVPGNTYYWKVVAIDAKGGKAESVVRSFTAK